MPPLTSSSTKISILKNNSSLNQKVQALLERCSHTNSALKDVVAPVLNQRNMFHSPAMRPAVDSNVIVSVISTAAPSAQLKPHQPTSIRNQQLAAPILSQN